MRSGRADVMPLHGPTVPVRCDTRHLHAGVLWRTPLSDRNGLRGDERGVQVRVQIGLRGHDATLTLTEQVVVWRWCERFFAAWLDVSFEPLTFFASGRVLYFAFFVCRR